MKKFLSTVGIGAFLLAIGAIVKAQNPTHNPFVVPFGNNNGGGSGSATNVFVIAGNNTILVTTNTAGSVYTLVVNPDITNSLNVFITTNLYSSNAYFTNLTVNTFNGKTTITSNLFATNIYVQNLFPTNINGTPATNWIASIATNVVNNNTAPGVWTNDNNILKTVTTSPLQHVEIAGSNGLYIVSAAGDTGYHIVLESDGLSTDINTGGLDLYTYNRSPSDKVTFLGFIDDGYGTSVGLDPANDNNLAAPFLFSSTYSNSVAAGSKLFAIQNSHTNKSVLMGNGDWYWGADATIGYRPPTTNGTAGQALVTDGNTPQQLSWITYSNLIPYFITNSAIGGIQNNNNLTTYFPVEFMDSANDQIVTFGPSGNRVMRMNYLNASKLLRTDSNKDVAEVTIGSGLSFDGTTLTSTGSGGSVTSVSGSQGIVVTSPTTTPNIGALGNLVSNGMAQAWVSSNNVAVDVIHKLSVSNITASSLIAAYADSTLDKVTIGTGMAYDTSTHTLSSTVTAPTVYWSSNNVAGGSISNSYAGTVVINTNLQVTGGGSSNWIGGSLWVATNIVSLNGQFTGNGAGLTNIPTTSVGLLGDPITNGQAQVWSDSNDVHYVKAITTGTTTPTIYLTNATPATVGAQAQSPWIEQDANGWKTTSTAGSQPVGFRFGVIPVQSATSPGGYWKLESQTNNGTWGKPITFSWEGSQTNAGKWIDIGGTGLIIFGDSTVNGQIISAPGSGANLKLKGGTGPASITIASSSARDITWDGTSFYCSTGDRLFDVGQNGTGARAVWMSKSATLNDTTGIGFGTGESLFMSSVNSEVVLTNGAAGTAGQYADLLINGSSALGSDQTTTSATLASTTLSVRLAAGVTYTFQGEFFLSDSVAADGAKIDFNGGTATATTFIAQVTAFDTALNLSSQGTALNTAYAASTFTGSGAFEVHGTIFVNAAGTIIPQFAQNAHTTGTLTLKKGSFIRFFRAP